MNYIDFANSFLFWQIQGTTKLARFSLDSVAICPHDKWYLCSGVVAGNVYGKKMIKHPPYVFRFATNKTDFIRFRDGLCINATMDDDFGHVSQVFSTIEIMVKMAKGRVLSGSDLFEIVASGFPVQAKVLIEGCDRTELLFPIKHVNFHENGYQWQAETGPIFFPSHLLAANANTPLGAIGSVFFQQDGSISYLVRKSLHAKMAEFHEILPRGITTVSILAESPHKEQS